METGTAPRIDTHRYFVVDEERSREFERVWGAAPGILGYLREINNIPIAKRYIFASFAFFLVGGAFALLMRTQLAVPENDFLDPRTYNQLFTMHGTTMMFLFVIPFIEAVANYFLMLGTRPPFPHDDARALDLHLGRALHSRASSSAWRRRVGSPRPARNREFSPGSGWTSGTA